MSTQGHPWIEVVIGQASPEPDAMHPETNGPVSRRLGYRRDRHVAAAQPRPPCQLRLPFDDPIETTT